MGRELHRLGVAAFERDTQPGNAFGGLFEVEVDDGVELLVAVRLTSIDPEAMLLLDVPDLETLAVVPTARVREVLAVEDVDVPGAGIAEDLIEGDDALL